MGLLYMPDNALALRMYDWLEKAAVTAPAVVFPREKLIDLAKAAGFSREAAFTALKNLEQVCNIASYWDSEKRTVFFAAIPMTPEMKLKHIEDELWFEALPDYVPPPPAPKKVAGKKKK